MVAEVRCGPINRTRSLASANEAGCLVANAPSFPHRPPFVSYSSFLNSSGCTVVASFLNMDKAAVP